MSSKRNLVAVLLCFGGHGSAAKARRPLEHHLLTDGHGLMQTTIVRVNAKHGASVYDPRRVLAGTLTAALTWGLFGLVAGSNKIESTVIWAVLGAICGGLYAYMAEHLLTKDELARIGKSLPANSSALLTFAQTSDPEKLLAATASSSPAAASVAVIGSDLGVRVLRTSDSPGADDAVLSMVLLRYPDAKTAASVATRLSHVEHESGAARVELIVETAADGHRRVTDPNRGTVAWARSDVVSWGLFGLVFGAFVGYLGDGGLHGLVDGGVITGIGWAIFGLFAGSLYGLWAGRSVSARRLKSIGPLLGNATSALLAWADGSIGADQLESLAEPGSAQLVLRFNPVGGGAVLEGSAQ